MSSVRLATLFGILTTCSVACAEVDAPTQPATVDDSRPVAGGNSGTAPVAAGDAGTSTPEAPRHLRVFVTSKLFDGNLAATAGVADGREGGDVLCNRAANAAGLAGSFVAFLAPGTYPPKQGDLLAHERVVGDGPWYAVGSDSVVFADRAALTSVALENASAVRTEAGATLPDDPSLSDSMVWTGTTRDGFAGAGCAGWTANGPGAAQCGCISARCRKDDWREARYGHLQACVCRNRARLYCFQRPE